MATVDREGTTLVLSAARPERWALAAMLRSRPGGVLAELRLNCPAQQQHGAASKPPGRERDRETARERQRRPVLRTPHKTRLPAETRKDTEHLVPVVCTDPARTQRGAGIGTKIPTRATAPQPLLVGQREAERGRASHPLTSRTRHTEHSCGQTARAGEADRDGDSGRASDREMTGLKARIQRSQAVLAQLTEDTEQWLRDRDTHAETDTQRQTQRETLSGRWLRDVPSGNKTERQREREAGKEKAGECVYERLIRADAKLQMLAGLEQRERHRETQRDTQRRVAVAAHHMSSDE